MDQGLLLLRIAVGAALLLQAVGKLRPRDRDGVRSYFGGLGFEPAAVAAFSAGAGEAVAGALVLLGLLTPLGLVAALAVLLLAVWVNSAHGWSVVGGGAEYPVVLSAACFLLASTGPGAFSADAAFGIETGGGRTALVILVLAALAAAPVALRRAAVLRRRAAASGDASRGIEVTA